MVSSRESLGKNCWQMLNLDPGGEHVRCERPVADPVDLEKLLLDHRESCNQRLLGRDHGEDPDRV